MIVAVTKLKIIIVLTERKRPFYKEGERKYQQAKQILKKLLILYLFLVLQYATTTRYAHQIAKLC